MAWQGHSRGAPSSPDLSQISPRGDTLPLIRRLWRDWMRPHRRTLGGVLVLVALVAGATGLYPVLIKAAFDAFTAKDRQAILLAPLFVIVVTSVKGFSLLALTVLTNRVVTRIEADMQSALFGHLIDADLAQVSRESPAALTQRFTTDFLFIKEALTRLSTVFLREVTTIIALIAAMLWIDPLGTLVAAVTVPFIAWPIGRIGKKLRRVAVSTPRIQGSLIEEDEIERITEFWRKQGEPQTARTCSGVEAGGGQVRVLLRPRRRRPARRSDGHGRADGHRLHVDAPAAPVSRRHPRGAPIDMMERRGVISGYEGSKARQVLISEADLPRVLAGLSEPATASAAADPGA